MTKTLVYLTLIIWLMTPVTVLASGWPIPKKKAQFIPSYYHYGATAFKDKNGSRSDFGNNGRFSSSTFKLGFEYGFSNRLGFVSNIPIALNRYKDNSNTVRNSGFSDLEFGLKYNFFSDSAKRNFLTAQFMLIQPAYTNNISKQPYLGYAKTAIEGRIMYAGSSKKSYHLFHNTEIGYRRISSPQLNVEQWQLLSTLGIYLSKKDIITGDISGTFSKGSIGSFSATNPLQNTDFDFVKLTTQYGRQLTKNCWLYGGVFADVYNKNTGIGKGFMFFTVINL